MSIQRSEVRTEICTVCDTVHDLPLCPKLTSDEASVAHTPGPWIVFEPDARFPGIEGLDTVVVYGREDERDAGIRGRTHEEALANARLIAAAPELLAALKSITPAFNTARIVMQDKEARDLAGEIVAECRAAIAKAEGSK